MAGKDKPKRRAGRPRKEFSVEAFQALVWSQASLEELGAYFGTSKGAIVRLVSREPYRSIWQDGMAGSRALIKASQFKMMNAGNATMAIWLGKQYCGQRDNPFVLTLESIANALSTLEEAERAALDAGRTGRSEAAAIEPPGTPAIIDAEEV